MKSIIVGILIILLFSSVCSGEKTPWYKPTNNPKTNIFYRWFNHAVPAISEKIKSFDIAKEKIEQMFEFQKRILQDFKVTPKTGFKVIKSNKAIINLKEFE